MPGNVVTGPILYLSSHNILLPPPPLIEQGEKAGGRIGSIRYQSIRMARQRPAGLVVNVQRRCLIVIRYKHARDGGCTLYVPCPEYQPAGMFDQRAVPSRQGGRRAAIHDIQLASAKLWMPSVVPDDHEGACPEVDVAADWSKAALLDRSKQQSCTERAPAWHA